MNDRSEITWSPRISLAKIRELYTQEARGDCSDELIEEVGFGLYARCAAIVEFTAACAGQVRCKRCANQGKTTIIERKDLRPASLLRCPVCGWQVRWRVYVTESENYDGQLTEGHAGDAFRRYLARYPLCTTREEKIIAIDRLIHEFHWILLKDESKPALPNKPAGVNLLRGNTMQVLATLHELTYGENTPPSLIEGRDWWLTQMKKAKTGPAGRTNPAES